MTAPDDRARDEQPAPCPPRKKPCGGHKRYVGGIMDGEIAHLVSPAPSDFPRTFGTLLRRGQRSWYEIDDEASTATEVVYRCIGHGRDFPQRAIS